MTAQLNQIAFTSPTGRACRALRPRAQRTSRDVRRGFIVIDFDRDGLCRDSIAAGFRCQVLAP
jgi:hypothetical protein